jgi:hypothetical protein
MPAAPLVVSNAVMACTFGAAPAKLTALPNPQVLVEGQPAAVITDIKPIANVAAFGMCSSLANPAVAAATSAASGVLTPQPCTPVVAGPWTPGIPLILIGGQPAVNAPCKCTCAYAGVISVTVPGATQTLG